MKEFIKVVCVFLLIGAAFFAVLQWSSEQITSTVWALRILSLVVMAAAVGGFLWAHFCLAEPQKPEMKSVPLEEETPDPNVAWYADRHAAPPTEATAAANPYQAPQADAGTTTRERAKLRKIALYQKGMLLCLLAYVLTLGFSILMLALGHMPLPEVFHLPLMVVLSLIGVTSMVYVFLLASHVYNAFIGLVFAALMIVMPLNLLILLAVNAKTNRKFAEYGITTGFFGADVSKI